MTLLAALAGVDVTMAGATGLPELDLVGLEVEPRAKPSHHVLGHVSGAAQPRDGRSSA